MGGSEQTGRTKVKGERIKIEVGKETWREAIGESEGGKKEW